MTVMDPRWQKRYRLDRSRGLTRTIPADPVRARIAQLRQAGASVRGIASAAGVTPSAVSRLGCGQARVSRYVAASILAVTLDDVRSRSDRDGFVPKIGAVRRIQGMLALGWPHQDIDAALSACGCRTHSHLVLSQRGEWIAGATHDAVLAVYADLGGRPGPSERSRSRAARLGYVPPAMWDDEALDDPAARPAEVDDDQASTTDRLDEWMHLVRSGEDRQRAAVRCGWRSLKTVERAACRYGRRDVLDLLQAVSA